jgi:hypothetical protein
MKNPNESNNKYSQSKNEEWYFEVVKNEYNFNDGVLLSDDRRFIKYEPHL